MVFYINPQGVVQTIFSETVNQGSVEFNDIIVVTHFSANVSILITLPNGIKLPAYNLASSSAIEQSGIYAYRVILDEAVTEFPGLLSFRFMLETEGRKLASTVCTLPIGEGAGIDLGSPLNELGDGATDEEIIATINQLVEKFNTVIDAVSSARDFKNAAKSYKDNAEAWAVGTIDGEPVPNDAEQHDNNAKYYAEQTQEALNEVREGFVSKKNSVTAQLYGVKNNEQQMFDTGTTPTSHLIPQRDSHGDVLVPSSPQSQKAAVPKGWTETHINTAKAETIAEMRGEIANITEGFEIRLEQLESATLKYTEDSSTVYEKLVPNGSAKYAIIEKVGGMTYKCNNLLKLGNDIDGTYDGVNVKVNDDGSITFNGTLSNDHSFSISLGDIQYDWNSIYTFSLGIDVDDWLFSYYEKYSPDDTEEWDTTRGLENGSATFSAASSGCYIFPPAGTYNNFTIYPMLNYGNTALPFEPYFEGLRDTKVTSLVSEGANLLNTQAELSVPSNTDSNNATPRTFVPNTIVLGMAQNNYYNPDAASLISRTKDSITFTNRNGYGLSFYFELKPNTTYTISCRSSINILQIGVAFYNAGGTVDSFEAFRVTSHTFTTNQSGKILIVFADIDASYGDTTTVTLSDIMLNEGATAVPYKPYRSEAVDTFPISEALRTFLAQYGYGRGIKGYEGYIDFEKKQFIPPQTQRIVLNGSENWVDSGYSFYYITLSVNGTESSKDFVSSRYGAEGESTNYMYVKGNLLRAYVTNEFPTLAKWTSSLQSNPITLEYATASVPEPIDISTYLTEDNIIEVEGGGVIKADNTYNQAAPTTIEFVSMKGD